MKNNAIQNAIKRDMDNPYIRFADCEKVGREEAEVTGQIVYWPETTCRHGHMMWRYTSTGRCLTCLKRARIGADEDPPSCMKAMRHIEAQREARELALAISEPWEIDDE